jgi:hypothetical protein
MNPWLLIGLAAYALSSMSTESGNRRSSEGKARPYQGRSRSSEKVRYVDDGALCREDAVAIVTLLSKYKAMDGSSRQSLENRMDARVLAQFNHLLNSTWSMDNSRVMDYLEQQGRQGRYTELGAFAGRLGF